MNIFGRKDKSIEQRVATLERTVEMLENHEHNAKGDLVIPLFEAEEAVWSAQREAEDKAKVLAEVLKETAPKKKKKGAK